MAKTSSADAGQTNSGIPPFWWMKAPSENDDREEDGGPCREHCSQTPQREARPSGVGIAQQLAIQPNADLQLSIVFQPLLPEFVKFHALLH